MRNANWTMSALVSCVCLLSAAAVQAQDWPQWRGPNRDNKVTGFTAPATWPKELKQQWQVNVGLGESSPVLVRDRLYVFSRQGGDEVIRCLDAGTGKEVWQNKYATGAATGAAKPHPGPRSTPAVGEGKVCTLGVRGILSCLDAASGRLLWRKDTNTWPQFFTSSSPLIVDGKCIAYVKTLTAFDLGTGEVKWSWPGSGTPYGSPVLMTVAGVRMVVTPTLGGIAGVGLADGKPLWQVKFGGTGYQGNFSTPIIDNDLVIYTAAAKGAGSGTAAFRIEKKGDGFTATEVWKKSLAAHKYHTPVLKDGLLFGVTTGLKFFCLDVRTGTELWEDTKSRGQCGSILDTGSVLLALTSDKQLVVFQPNKQKYEEVAKYQVATAETWSVPIVVRNQIFVKDKGGSLTLWTIE